MTSVLVVGAGVAGLSAALALARRGARVEVIDHVRQWQVTGAGLTLGAATYALTASAEAGSPSCATLTAVVFRRRRTGFSGRSSWA